LIAFQQARATGQPVIVADQTSKTTTVYANPDQSFTSTVADGPVQEPDASSPTGYTPIDLALKQQMSGGWAPRVSDASVVISNGGSATPVTMTQGANQLALKWASTLPTPTINGSTATYKQVAPGVDLVVQALTSGFDFRIVLTRRPASAASYTLPLSLTGLTVGTTPAGGLALQASGKTVIAADQPVMYDASQNAAGEPAHVAIVPMAVTATGSTGLTLAPQDSFLSDASTVYPVTIDPAPNLAATIDTYVDSSTPTGGYANATVLKSGLAATGQTTRTLLQFDTSAMSGANVSAASLNLYESYSGSCTATGVQVWDLQSSWVQWVTWNTQPTKNAKWASANTGVGFGVNCPANWVSLSTGGTGSNTLAGLVQKWANGTATNNGLEVISADEASTSAYKRFSSNETGTNAPYLAVTYNFPPTVTSLLPNNAGWATKTTPTLSGTFNDPDTGTVGQIQYELDTNGGTVIDTQLGSSVPAGSTSSWSIPAADGLTNGTTYKWRARGYDGTDYGTWSGYRTFTVDTTAPGTPAITSSTHPNPTQWYPGYAFTGAWSAVSDATSGVAGYAVKIDTSPSAVPSGVLQTGLSYTKTVTYSNIFYLHVRAEDNAGNWGQTATFEFNVGAGAVLSPAKGDRTQQYFTLQAAAGSTITGATFQYRRGRLDTWTTIPVGDVVDSDNGSAAITWPVSFFGTAHTTHHLRWDAKSTLGSVDGAVLVRVIFPGNSTTDPVQVALDQNFFDESASQGSAFAPVGPGEVNLVTGDYTLGASDANVAGFSVDRMFDSTTPNAQSSGVFGPGWSASLNLGTYQNLHSGADSGQGTFVTIYGADDTEYDFYSDDVSATYNTLPQNAGMTLVKCTGLNTPVTGCPASGPFLLTDQGDTQTVFTKLTGGTDYAPTSITPPNNGSAAAATTGITYTVVNGVTRPTQEVAPPPSGVDCSTSPLTTRGCQTLTFTYATANTSTSTCSTSYGDRTNQLKTVSYTAWDPSSSQMSTVVVAGYSYDTNGRLRAVCDPRITPVLATTYAYDGSGRVSSVTPPGLNGWTLSYDASNRITSASRANDPTGTQTTSVIYSVPLSGSGAPYDLSAAAVAMWAQQDIPTGTGTAIFPSSEVPSGNPPADYNYATIYYMDANGNQVNVAEPGGYITTSEYDQDGNLARQLTAQNRANALTSTDSVSYSLTHDTQSTYDSTGTQLLRVLGPDHQVMLNNGTITTARADTQYTYDPSHPTLVTSVGEGALQDNTTSDTDVRTTSYDYSGQSGLGFTLFQPTSTTVDPGTGNLNLTTTTKYDSVGRVIATIMPAHPAGGDAHETDTTYYQNGTGSGVTACDNRPEWSGLICQTAPAAQPGTSGYPDVPLTSYSYDIWGDVSTRFDTVDSNTRTLTNTYDAAGRLTHRSLTGPGTIGPTVDYAYSSTTRLPTTTSTTSGQTTQTITRAYDQDGRLKTYTDADGNQTTYAYDTSSGTTSINDGKGIETLSYDQGSERRGLLTGITDSQAGAFTANYDADGTLVNQAYPNGMTGTTTIDSTGTATALAYVKKTNCSSGCTWFSDQVNPSIHGQSLSGSSSLSSQAYTYDAAGRLTWTYDTAGGQCTTRQYGFDGDSNRTSLTTRAPNAGGSCNTTASGTVQSSSYDAADRVTTTGYTFDSMGRITTVPAVDNGGQQPASLTYFVNGMVSSLAENGTTDTMSLDPISRVRQVASTLTKTYHYANDGDSPVWIAENAGGTTWTRNLVGPTGLIAIADQTNSAMLQLTNLHGDVVADATTSSAATSLTDTYEQTEYGQPRSGSPRYGWLGSFQRERDATTGVVSMGARVYNPYTGRFLQADPVPGGSANAYDYAAQDPINNSDINGLWYKTITAEGHLWHAAYGFGELDITGNVIGIYEISMSVRIIGWDVHAGSVFQVDYGYSVGVILGLRLQGQELKRRVSSSSGLLEGGDSWFFVRQWDIRRGGVYRVRFSANWQEWTYWWHLPRTQQSPEIDCVAGRYSDPCRFVY
jgi:RHS repeat-associated protein